MERGGVKATPPVFMTTPEDVEAMLKPMATPSSSLVSRAALDVRMAHRILGPYAELLTTPPTFDEFMALRAALYWAELDIAHYRGALEQIRDEANDLDTAQTMAEDGLAGADRDPGPHPTVNNEVV